MTGGPARVIEFAEWRPDAADTFLGASQTALNVLPALGQYEPFKEVFPFTDALPDRCIGAISGRNLNTGFTYAGTASGIYELQTDSSWRDVTKAGGYTTPLDGHWDMVRFGDRVIATNLADPVQFFEVGASSTFDDLGGSPPKARYVAIIRDFVVLSNLEGSPTEVAWSGINNPEIWTPGSAQSGRQLTPDVGECHGVFGQNVGYVFYDRAIYRMPYVGSPLLFRFDKISSDRGAYCHGGIAAYGDLIFFLAPDGFFQMQGENVMPIGHEKIDETILATIDGNFRDKIQSAIDPVSQRVLWSYVSFDSPDEEPDKIVAYSWVTQRWTQIEYDPVVLLSAVVAGYTLERLDELGNLDALTVSLDDPSIQQERLQIMAFNRDNRLGPLSGASLPARVETKDEYLIPGQRSIVTGARPITDADNATIAVGGRDRISDPITYDDPQPMEDHGMTSQRKDGRVHRFRMDIPAASQWRSMHGVEIEAVPVGHR